MRTYNHTHVIMMSAEGRVCPAAALPPSSPGDAQPGSLTSPGDAQAGTAGFGGDAQPGAGSGSPRGSPGGGKHSKHAQVIILISNNHE
jgi:hypothetical protein